MKRLAWCLLFSALLFSACHPSSPDGLTIDTGLKGPELPVLPADFEGDAPENYFAHNLYNAQAELAIQDKKVPLYNCNCYRLGEQIYVQMFQSEYMDGISGFGASASADSVYFYEMKSVNGISVKQPAKGSLVLNQHNYVTAQTLIGELKASGENTQLSGTFHCVVTEPRLN